MIYKPYYKAALVNNILLLYFSFQIFQGSKPRKKNRTLQNVEAYNVPMGLMRRGSENEEYKGVRKGGGNSGKRHIMCLWAYDVPTK